MWDPVACCGDLRYEVVDQPGKLRSALMSAGKSGPVHIVYQPRRGDPVEHWEHVGWLCIAAGNMILVGDEVDQICSAGSPKNAQSAYWKKNPRMAALDHIVNYGRHARLAFVGIARAPQDVWRRLTGQSYRMIVFRMDERLEMEAVRGRLGSATDHLPNLGKYEYIDWHDGGDVVVGGGAS